MKEKMETNTRIRFEHSMEYIDRQRVNCLAGDRLYHAGRDICFRVDPAGCVCFGVIAGGGLPVIIAELMANACMATGVCDYQTLLGVFGFAAVVSTSYAIFFVTIIRQPRERLRRGEYRR